MALIKSYRQDRRFSLLGDGAIWFFWRAWEHFCGAVGLVLFGLLLVNLAPNIAHHIRSAFEETWPTTDAENGARRGPEQKQAPSP